FSISNPWCGTNLQVELIDERDYGVFFGLTLGQTVPGHYINKAWQGYIFKIVGGSTKTGAPLKQGVLAEGKKRLMLHPGTLGFRNADRKGVRKRKGIAGCIINEGVSVLNLILVKKGIIKFQMYIISLGKEEIEDLTNKSKPLMKGPKRASKIVKVLNLKPTDNVTKFVIKRKIVREGKRNLIKKPRIMRLTTSAKKHRQRRHLTKIYKSKIEKSNQAKEYAETLLKVQAAAKAKSASHGKSMSKSRMSSAIIVL
ncbi:MAG: hypothetical protein MHPSP_002932, partial [Paramarteilia canceri]